MENWFIWAIFAMITFLLAFIFLHETISLKQVVGLFFALTAMSC
jgi:uncharacterized membrane protein